MNERASFGTPFVLGGCLTCGAHSRSSVRDLARLCEIAGQLLQVLRMCYRSAWCRAVGGAGQARRRTDARNLAMASWDHARRMSLARLHLETWMRSWVGPNRNRLASRRIGRSIGIGPGACSPTLHSPAPGPVSNPTPFQPNGRLALLSPDRSYPRGGIAR
jgi:hypothetical protein